MVDPGTPKGSQPPQVIALDLPVWSLGNALSTSSVKIVDILLASGLIKQFVASVPPRSDPQINMTKQIMHIVDIKGVYITEEEWENTSIWIDRAGSYDALEFDRDNIVKTIVEA